MSKEMDDRGVPKIGEITIPVYLMMCRKDAESSRTGFECGFAFFTYADCICSVDEQDDGSKAGDIGATMGGHTFVQNATGLQERLLIDVRDKWHAVQELLETPEGRAKVLEAIERYPQIQEERRAVRETRQAKREAEKREAEEKKLEAELAALEAEEGVLDDRLG